MCAGFSKFSLQQCHILADLCIDDFCIDHGSCQFGVPHHFRNGFNRHVVGKRNSCGECVSC